MNKIIYYYRIKMYTFKLIDLSLLKNNKKTEKSYNNLKIYDFKTRETFRMKRIQGRDVFNGEIIPDNECFKYYYMWDPYTGEKLSIKDKFGPLCFNGFELCYYLYKNRLNGLWNEPNEDYDGYYGELLGTGKNINIISRGCYPERYLLRLPIIDCYLHENSKISHVTMGPILEQNEIEELDKILDYNYTKFNKYISNTGNIMQKIKYHYDEALNQSPNKEDMVYIDICKQYPELNNTDKNEQYNRYHVDILKKL